MQGQTLGGNYFSDNKGQSRHVGFISTFQLAGDSGEVSRRLIHSCPIRNSYNDLWQEKPWRWICVLKYLVIGGLNIRHARIDRVTKRNRLIWEYDMAQNWWPIHRFYAEAFSFLFVRRLNGTGEIYFRVNRYAHSRHLAYIAENDVKRYVRTLFVEREWTGNTYLRGNPRALRMYGRFGTKRSDFRLALHNFGLFVDSGNAISSSFSGLSGFLGLNPYRSKSQTAYDYEKARQNYINLVPGILPDVRETVHDYVPWFTLFCWIAAFLIVGWGGGRILNRQTGGYALVAAGILIDICGTASGVIGCPPWHWRDCLQHHKQDGCDCRSHHIDTFKLGHYHF